MNNKLKFIDLLKEAKIATEETDSFIKFTFQQRQYQYDVKQNILSHESQQGLKPLNDQAENELRYLLKYESFAKNSQQTLAKLERGELDPAIKQCLLEFELDVSENTELSNKKQRLREIDCELQNFDKDDYDVTITKLRQQQAAITTQLTAKITLAEDIEKKQQAINSLKRGIDEEQKREDEESLADLLARKAWQFKTELSSCEFETSNRILRNEAELAIDWKKFEVDH